ncbi:GXWXG protein-domain-containing protein [Macrophomina phaseolina]|uniref:GXWXG protein-domain-containing protein n=1 Tax=Macrophomina phaseolina TaxID=35725 RepID=A0ABQ8GJM8_9PEZI|nr:GXWXG protein-domain-containing protein [Macrophomina phaseolina]
MFMMVLGSQCSGTSFAQSRALELISATLADPTRHVQPAELFDIIDPLPPLSPEELLGEWSATGFNTGHPLYHWLKSINWVGTKFWSEGDVEPLVVATQTRDGCGTRKRWLTEWGNGQILEVKYRGVVSAALFFDNHPIVTHFRKVSGTALFGIIVSKQYQDIGPFFFFLVP